MTAEKAPAKANAAIQFHPDAYETARHDLMGRHAAGEGFLRGYLRYAQVDRLFSFGDHPQAADGFAAFAKATASTANAALPLTHVSGPADPMLGEAGTLFVPGPGIDEFTRPRRAAGADRRYSLCGVTHTISSHRAMDALNQLASGAVRPWDAVICTSTCVREAAETLLAEQEEHLRATVGATAPRPQLPIIPLGVDCDALDPVRADAARWRHHWRQDLGIGEADLVVLFVGRLSFHAKAHPLPMVVALDEVARTLGRPLHLVQSGWFPNEAIGKTFQALNDSLGTSLHHHVVDGRTEAARTGIWYAADVFCSLSDNIQETFGLTPVEAMAAGLPVVVSDWNGYRDTVPEAAGFRVPTFMPPPGAGQMLAADYASGRETYDRYCGYACLATAVDPRATREAFQALLTDGDRRRAMAAAGLAHSRARFDWSVVIKAYQELWGELARMRAEMPETDLPDLSQALQVQRPDPMALFSHYPTHTLGEDSRLRWTGRSRAYQETVANLAMNAFGRTHVGPGPVMAAVSGRLQAGEMTIAQLLKASEPKWHERLWRDLGWLLKMGVVEVVNPRPRLGASMDGG